MSLLLLFSGTPSSSVTASDSVTTSDTATRAVSVVRTASDTVTTSDAVIAAVGARTASDSLTTSDSASRTGSFSRTASDTVTVSTAVAPVLGETRTASDAVTTTDASTRSGSFHRTAADTVTISTVVVIPVFTAADTLTTSDAITRTGLFHVTASDVLAISDQARSSQVFVTASDTAMFASSVSAPTTVSSTGGHVLTDTFNRTVAPGNTWGTGELGQWTEVIPGGSDMVSVTPGDGIMPDPGGGWQKVAAPVLDGDTLAIQINFVWPTGAASVGLDFGQSVFSFINDIEGVVDSTGAIEIFDSNGADDLESITPPTAGLVSHLLMELDPVTGVAHIKFWQDPNPEPGWQAEITTPILISQIAEIAVFANPDGADFNFSSVGLSDGPLVQTGVPGAPAQPPTTYVYIGGTYVGGSSQPGPGNQGGTGSGNAAGQIEFATAYFTSYVNGKPGEAYMRVRDLDSSVTFSEGDDWLMVVDGQAVWRGFVTQVVETYYAPVVDLAVTAPMRVIDLRGSDLNFLFTRRVVYKKSNPTVVEGTQFAAGTDDTVAITELLNNWLDLSGDLLNTTSEVVHVGDVDPAQKTEAWSGGWYWNNAMDSIATIPAAIYYIRPEIDSPHGTLVYGDVDIPTAPFGLSDVRVGESGWRTYREMEITLDGTSLANDVYGWGFGYGSQVPVFDNESDATSISQHGLWQAASVNGGVYKQATIDRIVESILDGSPSSHRGAKDDRPYVTLVTYHPGLLAGHVVNFESQVWGFSDAIPIRQLTLKFEAPDVPRYELILSHEIDAPWGFFDIMPIIPFPGIPTIRPPIISFPPPPPPPPPFCDCGITDTASRTVATTTCSSGPTITGNYWGTADCGIAWTVLLDPVTSTSVDGSAIVISSPLNPGTSVGQGYLGTTVANTGVAKTFTFNMDVLASSMGVGSGDVWDVDVRLVGDGISGVIHINSSGSFFSSSSIGIFGSGSTSIPDNWWQAALDYVVTMSDNGTDTTISIFDGITTYSYTATGLVNAVIDQPRIGFARDTQGGSTHPAINVSIGYVDIPEIDRCLQPQFDNFNRTVSGSAGVDAAGTATPSGIIWKAQTFPGGTDFGVNGTELFCGLSGGTFKVRTPVSGGPWQTTDLIEFETRFYFHQDSGVLANFEAFTMEMRDASNNSIGWIFQIGGTGGGFILYSSPSAGVTLYSLPSGWTTIDYSTNPVWFHVRWQVTQSTGDVKAKVWMENDGEPSDWQVIPLPGYTQPMDMTTARFSIQLASSFANRAGYVDYVNWTYDNQPCYYDGTTPVDGVPPAPLGPGLSAVETAIRISSTVYATTRTFVPGSTTVYRNGAQQTKNIDYVEGTDNQSVTFLAAVPDTDIIKVGYIATPTTGSTGNFLNRPASSPVSINGGSNIVVENIAIQSGVVGSGIGITIQNATNITIRDVDLADLAGGIYLLNCSGTLDIDNVRSRNIGDNTIGSGHSNHIQMNGCVFDGTIHNSKFLGGHTEDMVSIFQSGGVSAGHELIVENNQLQGMVADTPLVRAWTRNSGTGIIIGDGPGSGNNGHTIVRNNTLLTPGQVGIQIIDGPAIHVYDNIIVGQKRPLNNNPLTSFAGNPIAEVDHIRYFWQDDDGHYPSFYFGAGTINDHDNTFDSTLNASDYMIDL